MRLRFGLLAAAAVLALVPTARAEAPVHAYHLAPPVARALPASGLVAARDAHGVPTFVWGVGAPLPPHGASPVEAARAHARRFAHLWGLSPEVAAAAELERVHDTGRGGIVVALRPAAHGVPVFHASLRVLLRRDGSLVALSGGLVPPGPPLAPSAFGAGEAGAVARALAELGFAAPVREIELPRGPGWRSFELVAPASGRASGLRFVTPARARRVLFPGPTGLVPAHHVEVLAATTPGGPTHARGYVFAASGGALLYRRDLVAHDAYAYRVWAEPGGDQRPLDGPVEDFSPHPTGAPDGSVPAFVPAALVTVDGLDKFGDPWLPPGATQSVGNHVDAYTDQNDLGAPGATDLRASLTAPFTFDYAFDTAADPLATPAQAQSAVTQLFYTTNWQHDWWYDSGFDEPAGNAQDDNYGRGGVQGDRLLAEAQDGALVGNANNANMATPEDGMSPRMQMFLWDGVLARAVTSSSSPSPLGANGASFGPQTFSFTGPLALANDGVGTVTDACEPLVGFPAGSIAVVDRGSCPFESKAVTAQAAGAAGVVVVNNQAGPPPPMPGAGLGGVTIPVVSVSQSDGAALVAALGGGPVTVTLDASFVAPRRDASLDNLVVSHEYGHYIHHRLVRCSLIQCNGQSEGWADFVALLTALRPGDDPTAAYADTHFAARGLTDAYFGNRRFPYSMNPAKNPLTFQHVQADVPLPSGAPMTTTGSPNNAEAHNTGEVWASMLFEGYGRLLQQSTLPAPPYTFVEARRRMTDYVVAGMALAPDEPSFTEQRDALLAAAYAADPADALLLAEGFAARGAGSCAVSPPKSDSGQLGVVESFEVAPNVAVTAVTLDDGLTSCDQDGRLDRDEEGTLVVTLVNASIASATDTSVTVVASDPAVTFPDGNVATVASLGPLASTTVSLRVALGATPAGVVAFTVTAANAAACEPEVQRVEAFALDRDVALASSAVDGVETTPSLWVPEGDFPQEVWAIEGGVDGDHRWLGRDVAHYADTSLVSPVVTASADQPLVVTFRHRHDFEATLDPPPVIYWGGGVVELRVGNGPWEDLAQYAAPGYGGVVGNTSGNVLADREAFVAKNPSWPDMDTVSISLGTQLAGEALQVRFRVGSDEAASAPGWELDDIGFQGIVETPFAMLVPDACGASITADAGPDQTVTEGDFVTLVGAGQDPDGDAVVFSWSQTGGSPTVALVPTPAAPGSVTFTAPEVVQETVLTFTLTATGGDDVATDAVEVRISPKAAPPPEADGGCGCSVPASRFPGGWLALGLGALALGRRRSKRGA